MEQWRYMEMQRQWMARQQYNHMSTQHHQQSHPQQYLKGLKRPLPNKPTPLTNHSINNHHSNSPKEDGPAEPPSKQPKLSSKPDDDKDSPQDGMEEAKNDLSSPLNANSKETTTIETSN